MNIKVSVIVAVRNGGKFLRNSLNSLKNQSLRDIEIIMVDALSEDNTAEIMKSYISDSRFSFYEFGSESISQNLNLAIEKAKGEYIAFCSENVIFTKNLLREMYASAKEKNADLCVSAMESSDIYGIHQFSSARTLLKFSTTDKFDTNFIWNPAVTNKLFKREKIKECSIAFRNFGKAREAAFSIPFVLNSKTITCCSKEYALYVNPVKNEGVSVFPIEHYLSAYEYIISWADKIFDEEISNVKTEFDKKELKKQKICYTDQIYHKAITVLLYSYYRHFWSLDDDSIRMYADIILSLYSKLSKTGKSLLKKKNKDIFYGDSLIISKSEMADNPKVTVCISEAEQGFDECSLENFVTSLYNQTMPSFEVLLDRRLYDIFPEKWKNAENIALIDAYSLSDFKNICLEKCKTDYIMFQDPSVQMNPKILMRHYEHLQGKEKYGFSTSPISHFDGSDVEIYNFSDLFFETHTEKSRIESGDRTYLLDLFFCNKLFNVSHLKGIHFSFSDNPVYDMYKLYKHSRFKKVLHRGSYFNMKEDKLISYLKKEERLFDKNKRNIFKTYKIKYIKTIKIKKIKDNLSFSISLFNKYIRNIFEFILVFIFTKIKIRNRVFFVTGRTTGVPDENLGYLYKSCDEKKVLFAKERPYNIRELVIKRYYLLTSKVIVTDDYLYFLRSHKLRDEQKVIQVWYTGGALKKMGIDGPSILSNLDEYKTHSQYSDFCVSSEYVRQYYCHAFGLDADVVKALGTPRSDLVTNKALIEKNKAEICSKHPLLKNKKVYVYCPTVRVNDDGVFPFETGIDWTKLDAALEDDEVFIISRHPSMKEEFIRGKFFSRVKDYSFENTSELLAVADVIITDYSSVVFDASLMNKPMVFYCPDYSSFKDEIYLDYDKDIPGEMITDSSDILSAVRRAEDASSGTITASFREKQMGSCDGNSTERILTLIKKYLK